MKLKVPAYFSFLLKVYLFNLLLFSLCRALLFYIAVRQWPIPGNFTFSDSSYAFLIGLQFDTVTLCYILALPFLVLSINEFLRGQSKVIIKGVYIFLFCALSIALGIIVSNIPYFLHFFSPLSNVAFLWADNPGYSIQMILQEKTFLVYSIPLILLIIIEYFFIRKQYRQLMQKYDTQKIIYKNPTRIKSLYFLFGIIILFTGVRGRLSGKTPIQPGSAFFCDNALLNNAGLNPVFTLVHSYIADLDPSSSKINLINEKDALHLASSLLNIHDQDKINNYPIARAVKPDQPKENMNVVVVIMEAMSKFKMGKWDGPKNLTPSLNRLITKSYYFDQIYTAGIHTFNGIYSTIYSYPALYKSQPLKSLMQIPHDGLGNILRKEGYQTSFFTTHDPEFDNVRGFLMANGFDRVYSELDYPSEWIQSTNGVADHKMFEYAIPQLDKMAAENKPFLSVFMTTSDHGPYIIPKEINFIPKSKELKDQIVEYADWSIEQFINNAKQKFWFSNTLFVFIADHGLSMGHTYDMPLSFHETPLIFYAPEKLIESKTFDQLGGQIDVAPTILGLLNIPYVNNTAGIDLLKDCRPFIYFCADDKIGCMDKEYYLILRKNGKETLYQYADLKTANLIDKFPSKVDSMKEYTFSMMQTTQWMIDQKKLKYKSSSGTN